MDRGAWGATVHGVAKESDMTEILNHYYQRHLQLVLRSCDYCMAKGPYRYDGVKDLEMRLSCIIWMGPKCNHKGPCVWEPRRSKEEVGEMVTKASGCHDETSSHEPRNAGILQKLEKAQKQIPSLSLQKEPFLSTL